MRSRATKLLVTAALFCLVTGLLGLAAIWGVVSGWQRERVTALVTQILARSLDTQVLIASIDGPLIPEFEVRGLQIGPDSSAPISASRIAVKFDTLALLDQRLSIGHIEIEGASVVLTRFADGRVGIAGLAESFDAENTGEPSSWSVELDALSLRDGNLSLEFEGEPNRSARLRIDASGGGISLPPDPTGLSAWQLSFRASDARADLGEELRVDDAHLVGELRGGDLAISEASISGSFGAVEVVGSAAVLGWLDPATAGSADVQLALRSFDPGPLGGPPGRIDASVRVEASVGAGRPLSELDVAGTLVLTPSTLAGRALHKGTLVGRLGPRGGKLGESGWTLTRADLFGEGIEITASGSGSAGEIDNLDIHAITQHVESLLGADPGLAGNLELTASLSGAWNEPVGTAALRVEQLVIADVSLGELTVELRSSEPGRVEIVSIATRGGELDVVSSGVASVTLDPDGASIEGLRLVAQSQTLSASGRLGSGGFDGFQVDTADFDIEALGRLVSLPLEATGRIDASLTLRGSYASPKASGSLDWRAGRIDAFAFDRIRAKLASPDADAFDLVVAVERESRSVVDAEFTLPREESLTRLLASPRTKGHLTADGFPLRWLSHLLPEEVALQRGILNAKIDLRGGAIPQAEGRISIDEGLISIGVDSENPVSLTAVLELEPHAKGIRISEALVSVAGESVQVSGVVTDAGLEEGSVYSAGVDLEHVLALLGIDTAASGTISAVLEVAGPFERPTASGRVTWRDARYEGLDLDAVDIDIDAGESRFDTRLAVRSDDRDLLVLDAKAPRSSEAIPNFEQLIREKSFVVDIEAHAVPLRIVQPFVPRQLRKLDGRLEATLKLRGGEPFASLEGVAELADGRFAVPVLNQTFEPISARLEVSERSIRVERAQIGADGASAKLVGSVGLDGLSATDLDLDLALEHFPLSRSPLLSANASGTARLDGRFDAPRLNGKLALENASASLRTDSDPAMKEVRVLAAPSAAAADARIVETGEADRGWAKTATVNFKLTVPPDSWIRGSGTELDVTGNLELHRDPGGPTTLVGEAEIVRGRYKFLTKRFDIRRGTAVFDGSDVPDPVIDLEAAHRVRDVTIVLFATGRASEPTIRLSSEPEMSESDVIAYLIAGRPANQGAGSGETGAGFESVAASFAAGVAATQAAQLIADATPLIDTLDIKIGENGVPSQVAVGRYVSDRVFVQYGKSIGDDADEASVEFKLTPNWSVQSTVTTDESAGADVIWSFDY